MIKTRLFATVFILSFWLVGCGSENPGNVAEADDATTEQATTTETAGADEAGNAGEDEFAIEKAVWKEEDRELRVKVFANPGDEIRVTSAADHDTVLLTHTVKESDKGSLKIEISGDVPCTVRVVRVQDDKALEEPVKDAPNCTD